MRIRITEIHEKDAFYPDEDIIGMEGELVDAWPQTHIGEEGWSAIYVNFDELQDDESGFTSCFFAVKYEEIEDDK